MDFDNHSLDIAKSPRVHRGRAHRYKRRRRKRMIIIFSFILVVVMLVAITNGQEIMWRIKMWNTNSCSYSKMVETAKAQLGNSWQKYCGWWGLDERTEWCAIFVCWCAENSGYTADVDYIRTVGTNGDIDMSTDDGAGAGDHARFHQKSGRYYSAESGYIPQSGDLIYFDWDDDNYSEGNLVMDHIGIVEKVEHGVVFTIEGNSKGTKDDRDLVRQKKYEMNEACIRGYSSLQ